MHHSRFYISHLSQFIVEYCKLKILIDVLCLGFFGLFLNYLVEYHCLAPHLILGMVLVLGPILGLGLGLGLVQVGMLVTHLLKY